MGDIARLEARGPQLHIGAGVVIDCRFLDRVELARRFPDRSELRLILAIGETEVALDFPGSAAEGEALLVELARYTRAAPVTSEEDYGELLATVRAIAAGRYQPPPVVSIEGDPVSVEDGLISTGILSYLVDAVVEAGRRGMGVELAGGKVVPAAILLLAVAAARAPELEPLERRLADYRETRRQRPAPS